MIDEFLFLILLIVVRNSKKSVFKLTIYFVFNYLKFQIIWPSYLTHSIAMQQNLPFNFKEVFKLTNLGLNPELFKFGSVTFESQKYICVKDAAVSHTPFNSNTPSNIYFIWSNYIINYHRRAYCFTNQEGLITHELPKLICTNYILLLTKCFTRQN